MSADGKPLRVLIVDDDRDAADSTALLVRLFGHAATVAYNGAAALEAARADPPDVVLLDLGMPGMDGFELAGRLHEQAGSGKKPLTVAVTGYADADHARRAEEAGFHLYQVKPADPLCLRRLLEEFRAVLMPGAEQATQPGAAPSRAAAPG